MTTDLLPAVTHHRWREYRLDPKWLQINTGWGSHRAVYPYVDTLNLSAHLVLTPAGQRSPWHGPKNPDLENMYLGMQGEVQFSLAGLEHDLQPLDMLIARNVPYSYFNPGFSAALFWVIRRKHEGAAAVRASGKSGNYFDDKPTTDADASDRVRFLSWADYQRSLRWPEPEQQQWGALAGSYEPILWAGVTGRVVRVPPAQKVASDALSTDVMYFCLTGEVDFDIGGSILDVHPLDVVALAPDVEHGYISVGSTDALLFVLEPRDDG